ncbi:ATP-binding protein [Streptomyces sp. NPDC097617]|uniref:ATP-binding protein n=1 Tax=Streptomyces sp. NPDC097617 TaxID=3366091 RepID=UPI00381B7947
MTTGVQAETLPCRHVLTLPAMGSAVRMARETTELILVEAGIGLRHPSRGPALLILSELVTNVIRHAAACSPTLTITYTAGPGAFAFAVHDRHPYQPAPCQALAAAPHSGLAMVATMTVELGGTAPVRPDADGCGESICITLPV